MSRRTPFPQRVTDFADDDRISYSQTDARWLLVDEDNEEWEFNTMAEKWFQPVS